MKMSQFLQELQPIMVHGGCDTRNIKLCDLSTLIKHFENRKISDHPILHFMGFAISSVPDFMGSLVLRVHHLKIGLFLLLFSHECMLKGELVFEDDIYRAKKMYVLQDSVNKTHNHNRYRKAVPLNFPEHVKS